MSRCWYSYQGGTGVKPQLVAANYKKITANGGKPVCAGSGTICAIYAPSCGATPAAPLSANIQAYITNALGSSSQEPVPPNKPYVYVKAG